MLFTRQAFGAEAAVRILYAALRLHIHQHRASRHDEDLTLNNGKIRERVLLLC